MSAVKEEVRRLLDELPEEATWDDVLYAIEVQQRIDEGLKALTEGRHRPVSEVRKRFGLPARDGR